MKAVRWEDIPDEQVREGVRRRGIGTRDVLLVMNECRPGMDLRPHSHDFDQLALIISGEAIYHVGDDHNEVGPGSVMLPSSFTRSIFTVTPRPGRSFAYNLPSLNVRNSLRYAIGCVP